MEKLFEDHMKKIMFEANIVLTGQKSNQNKQNKVDSLILV